MKKNEAERNYKIGQFDVSVDRKAIILNYNYNDKNQPNEFFFNISKYGKYLNKISTTSNKLIFNPEDEGVYKFEVTAIINGAEKFLDVVSVSFYSEKTQEKYEKYLEAKLGEKPEPTGFYSAKEPYLDFCAIIYSYKSQENFVQFNGYKTLDIARFPVKIICKSDLVKLSDSKVILSGQMNANGKYIYGQNDLTENDSSDLIENNVGGYSYILLKNDKVICGTDYFGLDSLYYFKAEDKCFVSNRYQMLVRILKKFRFDLAINEGYISDMLHTLNNFHTDYPFNDECAIKGIKTLPINKKFVVSDNGIGFVDAEIAEVFKAEPITDEEYIDLVYKAKEEMTDNARAIANSDHFTTYSMELTGGMDSRYTFAAVANVEGLNNKTFTINYNQLNNPEFLVYCTLTDDFGFNHEFRRRAFKNNLAGNQKQSYDDRLQLTESLCMHKLIDPNIFPLRDFDVKGSIMFNGQAVEACTRAYSFKYYNPKNVMLSFSLTGLENDFSANEIKKYLMFGNISAANSDLYCNDILSYYNQLPGKSIMENLDYLFLFCRMRQHFSLSKFSGYNTERWPAAMSKSAFRAFHLTYGRIGCYQFAFDLMGILNPKVAAYQYGDPKYDEIKKLAYEKSVVLKKEDYKFIPYSSDINRYNKQKEIYKDSISTENEFENIEYRLYNSKNDNIKDKFIYLRDILIVELQYLLKNCSEAFRDSIGIDLFYYLTEFLSQAPKDVFSLKIKSLYIKIHDIVAQIAEINNNQL